MGWLLASIYDRFMAQTEDACLRQWRGALLQGATGDVLEIGAGTGANLAHYPCGVRRLVLSEPDSAMRERLRERVASQPSAPWRAELTEASVMELPHPDASFDFVVSTLVLCSVPELSAALAEVRRVLRPGGKLLFLEHVCEDKRTGRRWLQHACEPVWKRFAGGCHLTRQTEASIGAAGFDFQEVTRESMRKAPPIMRASVRGVAVKA